MSKLEELIQELYLNDVVWKELGSLGKFYGDLTGKSKDAFSDDNERFITYKNVYSNPSHKIKNEDRVKSSRDKNQRTSQYGTVIFTGFSKTPDECDFSSVVTIKTDKIVDSKKWDANS